MVWNAVSLSLTEENCARAVSALQQAAQAEILLEKAEDVLLAFFRHKLGLCVADACGWISEDYY